MGNKIQFKRGLGIQIPQLAYGEPGFVSDEKELYIGTEKGNIKLTSKSEIKQLTSQLNTFNNEKASKIEVNVLDFGASGDGSDCTENIKNAINKLTKILSLNTIRPGIGGTLKFNVGKYKISDTIKLPIGITVKGEQSGLVNSSDINSGTVLILSKTKKDGSPWTQTQIDNDIFTKRIMFSTEDSGVLQMENLGVINEENDNQNSIFLLCGTRSIPYDESGITQGYFKGLRIMTFENIFYGSKLFDVTFDNCGFEFNNNIFTFNQKKNNYMGEFRDNYFVNCVFFENESIIASENTNILDNKFTNCYFVGTNTSPLFALYNSSKFKNNKFTNCTFDLTKNQNRKFFLLGNENSVFNSNKFNSCDFHNVYIETVIQQPIHSQFVNNKFIGCDFNNSWVNIEYEGANNKYVACSFIGNSYLSFKNEINLIVNACDFISSTANKKIHLDDRCNTFVISTNIFNSPDDIQIHQSCTNYKVVDNLNIEDTSK